MSNGGHTVSIRTPIVRGFAGVFAAESDLMHGTAIALAMVVPLRCGEDLMTTTGVRTTVVGTIEIIVACTMLACGRATSVTAPSSTASGPNGPITSIVVTGPTASGTNFQLTAAA